MSKNFIFALASLVGTIIGAGVFAIPYVMSKSGALACFFYFLILGSVVLLLHLLLGEVVLRTKGKHRLVGYAEKYLGKKAKMLITFSAIVGASGSLLAYIILAGKFASLIFPNTLPLFTWSFIVWAGLSFLVLLGIKSISSVELFMNIGLFAVIIIIFAFSLPKVSAINLNLSGTGNLFLPFGVVMFSLIGISAIPEITALLKKKKNLKKIIIITSIITVCFAFLFGLIISGVTGVNTTDEPFQGLLPFLGQKIIILGGIFGLLAVSTSFLIIANHLKNVFRLDYKMSYFPAFAIACFLPIILFFIGIKQFIPVIGVVGTFIGLVEGTALIAIYKKAKKEGDKKPAYNLKTPNFLLYIMIAIFVLGALAQLIYR